MQRKSGKSCDAIGGMLNVLGCPKSVFLSQTYFLQQCTFIQTWNQVCEMSRCLSQQNEMDRT